MIPYARHFIDEDDVQAVAEALRSGWLTTGPAVEAFEQAVSRYTGQAHGVAVSSGTAALHCAMSALDIGPGDEVITPAMTFAATPNSVAYTGGAPVFAEVDPGTLLLDPADAAARITPRTRAIIAVDYAGQACDYAALRALADRHGLALVSDACHSLGAETTPRQGRNLAHMSVFSFHPAKHVATGEGGMVTTDDPALAERLRRLRSHGIDSDQRKREREGGWFYQMLELGFNYRLSDIQCALGLSQLTKHETMLGRRREIARTYDAAFAGLGWMRPLARRRDAGHAHHLYVADIDFPALGLTRAEAFSRLRAQGVGTNVHYIPAHLHPYYREKFRTRPGQLPVTEAAYERVLSLPMFGSLTPEEASVVTGAVLGLADQDGKRP